MSVNKLQKKKKINTFTSVRC